MTVCNRREFIKAGARLAALLCLSPTAAPKVAEALSQLSQGNAPVLWLQAQSCSGCSVSLLNSEHPSPADLLTGYISLVFHSTLSTATGHVGMAVLNTSISKGGYILVVEGSVPMKMPEACVVGGEPVKTQILRAAQGATAIVAVGTCAASGGIPAAENNPTGAIGIPDFLESNQIAKPIISIPGCPAHPDWIVGTLVHVLQFGIPELDDQHRPRVFYGRRIHDQCPRFADYEREKFARSYGDEGCLFKLGCVGPTTHADCTTRLWNAGANCCINAGAPCIGCTSKDFAREANFAFYRMHEQV